jgi:hypothetical protein
MGHSLIKKAEKNLRVTSIQPAVSTSGQRLRPKSTSTTGNEQIIISKMAISKDEKQGATTAMDINATVKAKQGLSNFTFANLQNRVQIIAEQMYCS